MAYSEVVTLNMTPVEIAGIKHLIKNWCGLDINLVDGGPSVVDPCGDYIKYISFRDRHGNAIALRITSNGEVELVPKT